MDAQPEKDNTEKGEKRSSTLNPHAPEFNPSQTRYSGKLNADAPEFIPGQLNPYDGGIGYVSVPDVKHGKGYFKGGYPRPVLQMHQPDGQYAPRWGQPNQRYMQMWPAYQREAYRNGPPYEYGGFWYGGGRHHEGEGHARASRGSKHSATDAEGHKQETGATQPTAYASPTQYAHPKAPDGVERQRDARQPESSNARTSAPPAQHGAAAVGSVAEVSPTSNATSASDPKAKPLTWADMFRAPDAKTDENEAPKSKEPSHVPSAWKGRLTFAEMAKRGAREAAAQRVEEPQAQMTSTPGTEGAQYVATATEQVAAVCTTAGANLEVVSDTSVPHKHEDSKEAVGETVSSESGSEGETSPNRGEKLQGTCDLSSAETLEACHAQSTIRPRKDEQPAEVLQNTESGLPEDSVQLAELASAADQSQESIDYEESVQTQSSEESLESEDSEDKDDSEEDAPSSDVVPLGSYQPGEDIHGLDHFRTIDSSIQHGSSEASYFSESDESAQVQDDDGVGATTPAVCAAAHVSEAPVGVQDKLSEGSRTLDDVSESSAESPSQEQLKPAPKVLPIPANRVYGVDLILHCGFQLKKRGLDESVKQICSFGATREGRSGGESRRFNNHYEDRSYNAKQRGENWSSQNRHSKSEAKGFGAGFKASTLDFSRDHLEAVSVPQASESSWIIKQAKLKMDKDHQLVRKLMGLLNRLTVEKFDTIYQQVLVSGVQTYQQALMLVKIIFEKAITQHHFIPMYVELCAKLSYDLDQFSADAHADSQDVGDASSGRKSEHKGSKKSDFMRILLNCCQDSFENNLKPLEFPDDLEGDDKFEYELKYKHRMRGNMIFVGELFKQKLLAAKLLITCLDQVFAKREECIEATGSIDTGDNHLEGMCTLLQTVGKSFDTDKWKYSGEFEKRIQMLTDLGRNPKICFRIRCLIQNVLDSRHENWVKSTPYKLEGPCRLQELRSKVMEQEKPQERQHERSQDENVWRTRRRGRTVEFRAPSPRLSSPRPTSAAPNVLATPAAPSPITAEELKRRARGIVKEFVMSHDASEASLCVTELNLPQSRDGELFSCIFAASLEACAKITADQERRIVAKWLTDLAVARASQKAMVGWLHGFLKDKPVEHGYSMMIEDYPVVPLMLKELLTCMKETYAEISGFDEVTKIIEQDVYPSAGIVA
ncbi:MIF4G domain-containing protein [Babesia caballi]|uniref:MIF4G domain-containing protein n=1 Tax=Babesia caballi TaxID=5871 RepID=A0AAV4M0X9_BABCB|nr:MIF4G domain-containing protein [Babesia caballi]